MDNIRKIVREILSEGRGGKPGVITVYHGTHEHKEEDIQRDGLKSPMGYDTSQWYMVATDLNSAVFHATPEDGGDAIVFEFELPVTNEKWEGYPYFWPPYDREGLDESGSKWFALKQPLPSKFIKKVHRISNDDYQKAKVTPFEEGNINEEREVEGIGDKTKLSVFDFDGTLVNTPTDEEGIPILKDKTGKELKGNWWINPNSLNTDIFDITTNPGVISAYKSERSNSKNLVVMMTGRLKKLSGKVEKILDMHGLKFDDYLYNSGAETSSDKIKKMELALKYNDGIRTIEMWDDRDKHIPIFEEWGQEMINKGYLDDFKINHIKGGSHINESVSKGNIKCPHIQLTQEIVDYVNDYASDENLLRSGGIPIELLHKAAYGFSVDSVKTLMPEQLKVRWKTDLENVKWEIEKQGIDEKTWAQYIDLTEPIEVEYWKDEEEGFEEGFYISDGHHRYYAAKILNKPLNVKLEIKTNPIEKLTPGIGYDDFHRCLFKQVKEEYGYKEISRNFLKQFANNVTDKIAKNFLKGWIEREGGDKILLSQKEYFILKGIQRTGKVPKTSVDETVRGIVREELLDETHTGQKDLEKFTNNILHNMSERIVRDRERMEFVTQGVEGESNHITSFPLFFTGTMKGEGYNEIEEFVNDTSIKIMPTTRIPGSDTATGQLGYASPDENFGREIFELSLKYSQRDLDEINELFDEKKFGDVGPKDVYFKLFYIFYTVLLHELQHAYDAWRSKGKALRGARNKEYIAGQEKARALSKVTYDDLTPEERKAISNSHKDYQNLVHEINARYAQAIQRVNIKTMDDAWNEIMTPWKKVHGAFQSEFDGWRNLSDKMKKKLTRRLAKAYQEESENLQTAVERFGQDMADEILAEVRKIVRDVLSQ